MKGKPGKQRLGNDDGPDLVAFDDSGLQFGVEHYYLSVRLKPVLAPLLSMVHGCCPFHKNNW